MAAVLLKLGSVLRASPLGGFFCCAAGSGCLRHRRGWLQPLNTGSTALVGLIDSKVAGLPRPKRGLNAVGLWHWQANHTLSHQN